MTPEPARPASAAAPAHRTSRLDPPDASTLPEPARRIFNEETRQFGGPLNTTMVWAHHPALLAGYRVWSTAMREATLIPPDLKYLVYVRVASLNGCPF